MSRDFRFVFIFEKFDFHSNVFAKNIVESIRYYQIRKFFDQNARHETKCMIFANN